LTSADALKQTGIRDTGRSPARPRNMSAGELLHAKVAN